MAITTSAPALPFGAVAAHRVVSAVSALVDAYNNWQETRRTVVALRALSPAQLDDIGLTSADIAEFSLTGRFSPNSNLIGRSAQNCG